MHHPASVPFKPNLELLTEEIGDLRYDRLADFMKLLSEKLSSDAAASNGLGRPQLSAFLESASVALTDAERAISAAWSLAQSKLAEIPAAVADTASPDAPVLFLDFDGVILCTRTHAAFGDSGLWHRPDPVAIAFLNRLHEETGCLIVISSSKRLTMTRDEIERMLRSSGWTGEFHPSSLLPMFGRGAGAARGEEIRHWLDLHPEVTASAALDDSGGYEDVVPLIRTDPHNGISFQSFELLKSALIGGPVPDGMDASLAAHSWPGIQGTPYDPSSP